MADSKLDLAPGDALLVVDMQKDFCPGGALAVPGGDAVVPVLNKWIDFARAAKRPVYFSRDWHPTGHLSFEPQGGPWPPHCIQDTEGAAFHPKLHVPEDAVKVSKGVRLDKDQYSAFDETGLGAAMREAGVRRVWVGGLARDVCVRASVLDALREGFEVCVLSEAARPITPEGGEKADAEMKEAGARIV